MKEENVCHAVSSPTAALTWTTIAFFAGFAGVSAFGPIVSQLKKTMDPGPLWMGLLAASPALTGSLLRIPFGAMVDRTGGKKPIVILLGLAALGLAGTTALFSRSVAPGPEAYPLFLTMGILCGCGIAVFSVGVPTVSYWYPQKAQGSALALYAGLGNLAPGIFALLLPYLVLSFGFTASYVIWFCMLTGLTILVFMFMKDAPYFQYREMGRMIDRNTLLTDCGEELIPTGSPVRSLKKAASDPRTWLLTYCYFISFGGFIALTVWLPTFWAEGFGMTLMKAGLLTAVFSLSASLLRVAGGAMSDRFGGEPVAIAAFGVMATGSGILAMSGGAPALAFSGEMALAAGMGFANASVFKLVPKFMPEAVGGAAGIVGGLGAFGGFVIPPLMGYVITCFGPAGYPGGFWVFVGLSVAAVGVFPVLGRFSEKSAS